MTAVSDSLAVLESQLTRLTRRREQATLERWRDACAPLGAQRFTRLTQLRDWLHKQPTRTADEVLRSLVTLAQQGDATALAAVLVCLAPGIRALARRSQVTLDEAFSDVAVRVLEYPVARRRSVAGGILLDARNRLSRQRRRAPQPVGDVATLVNTGGANVTATSGEGMTASRLAEGAATAKHPLSAAERILRLVCEARRDEALTHDDAQLIVDTRINGQRMAPAAARLGISRDAAYQRRARAESRLQTTVS